MRKLILAVCCIGLLSGCASYPENRCGELDTQAVRDDIVAEFRTDREWYERLILNLAWQIDCERSVVKYGY